MTLARRPFLVVLALLALTAAVSVVWWASVSADGQTAEYELGAQIVTRLRDDGRIEFCFRPEGQALICPELRVLNLDRARHDSWIQSTAISWDAPIDPDRINYPSVSTQAPLKDEGCTPDFMRMFAATWKVETTSPSGTAFHIGGGRFVTAHHVVQRRPPFVSLIHGDRTLPAAVIGSDPEFDVALLEVERPELVRDLPTVQLREPTQADVGRPVYLIGYPGGEALTLHGGGVVTQVWDNAIQTNSAIRGGTSGGPMFDECGDVIGVVWAGSSNWAYTNSGAALRASLDRINAQWPSWPRVPADLPRPLDVAGHLVWHFDAEPPALADCSELDADWWIGLVGVENEMDVRADLERSGWRQIGVCGAAGPDDYDNGRTYIAALMPVSALADVEADGPCQPGADDTTEVVLYEAQAEFGIARLVASDDTPECADPVDYAISVDLDAPQLSGADLNATLIGRDGRLLVGSWASKSYEGATPAAGSPIVKFWQEWTAPADFEPVAFRVAIGSERWTTPLDASAQPELVAETSLPAWAAIHQSARIVARVEDGGRTIRACLQRDNEDPICPEADLPQLGDLIPNRWRESSPLRWMADVPDEALTAFAPVRPPSADTCTYQDSAHLSGWQFNSLAGTATAVYVGERQFLVSRYRLPDTAPWGVVTRDDTALPVIAVATDPRNDLALVEVFDPDDQAFLGPRAVFGSTNDALVGGDAHLLVYPAGSPKRFTLATVQVTEMTDRVLRVEPTGIGRHGGPLIDLCSGQVLALALGGDDLLRAETVAASLAEMRTRVEWPVFSQDGPPAHGSAAAYPKPLYAGSVQPEFSGKICDVHPSERYDQLYAVYVSRIDAPDIWRVYEEDGARPDRCDWGDKIFIVEYRADQAPEAICMEPYRPDHPDSTLDWELDAPDGIELLQATELLREDCPGLSLAEQTRWFSTHYFKLRNTGEIDFADLIVRVENAEGKRFVPRRDVYTFADDDVQGWRVRVSKGEPVKVVVTER